MTRQNAIPLEPNNNNEQTQIITKEADGKSNEKQAAAAAVGGASATETEEITNTPALIPFWDLANHMDGIVTTSYNVADAQVEGATLADVKKGEQIFIHYGNRNNANLLVHNG